jgi:hypothetical protein
LAKGSRSQGDGPIKTKALFRGSRSSLFNTAPEGNLVLLVVGARELDLANRAQESVLVASVIAVVGGAASASFIAPGVLNF